MNDKTASIEVAGRLILQGQGIYALGLLKALRDKQKIQPELNYLLGICADLAGFDEQAGNLFKKSIMFDPTCSWYSSTLNTTDIPETGLNNFPARILAKQIHHCWSSSLNAPGLQDLRSAQLSISLPKQAQDLLSKNAFSAALEAIERYFSFGLESVKARRIAAVANLSLGRNTEANRHIRKAFELDPGHIAVQALILRVVIDRGDLNEALTLLTEILDKAPGFLLQKDDFYTLKDVFTRVSNIHGQEKSFATSKAFLALPIVQQKLQNAVQISKETFDCLSGMFPPNHSLSPIIDSLKAGDGADAIDRLSALSATQDGLPLEDITRTLSYGPDKGHLVWHALNPYFYLWARAAFDDVRVQSNWQTSSAIQAAETVENLVRDYSAFKAGKNYTVAKETLRRLLGAHSPAPCFLDLGCGHGYWLRYIAETSDVPVENLFGIEYHESRTHGARALLKNFLDTIDGPDFNDDRLEHNIFTGDILTLDGKAFTKEKGPIDVISLFVVTGCFDDAQLKQVLRFISDVNPTYILATTVLKKWSLWHGRDNEDTFFETLGYQVESQEWDTEFLEDGYLEKMTLPDKYWINRRVTVYKNKAAVKNLQRQNPTA